MTRHRAADLAGRILTVHPSWKDENPRVPFTHGWLAFEVLRRADRQALRFEEYERRLFNPGAVIRHLARQIPGVRDAYMDLKHIRCDIYRGAVTVEPELPPEWYDIHRCSEGQRTGAPRRPDLMTR